MLFLTEILMLVGGIQALRTGKIPDWLFRRSDRVAPSQQVRLLGLWMSLPIPVSLVGGIVLALLFGNDGTGFAAILELVTVGVVAVVALIVYYSWKKPVRAGSGANSAP